MNRDELRELDKGLAAIKGETLPDDHGKPAWESDLEQWVAAEEVARPWRAAYYSPLEQRGLDASEAELVGLYATRLGESADRATRRVHQLLSEAWQSRGGWEPESARRNRVGLALSAELSRLRTAPAIAGAGAGASAGTGTVKTTVHEFTRLGESRTPAKSPITKKVRITEVTRPGGPK